ncbi:MAG: formylmethanofuran dehydrogenase subunit C [Gammaproteobacteria bacterium]
MTPLALTLRERPGGYLDMSALTPDRLAGLDPGQVKALEMRVGTEHIKAGKLFDIRGRDTDHLILPRGCDRFIRLGRSMTRGSIDVCGHGGQYIGQGMSGGEIRVDGDTGDWTAAGMRGGTLHVSGNVGDFTGAGLPGDVTGMSNGCVVIRGDSGDRLGDRMRRGTILVFGNAGDFAGSGMKAGTLVILGQVGRYPGHGMHRGTIVLGNKPRQMPLTFQNCGNLKMEFLRLFFKQISTLSSDFAFFRGFGPEAHRLAGDRAAGGQGEILILLNADAIMRA